MTLNSHNFGDMYTRLGIDLDTLGCVMLQVEPIKIAGLIPEDWAHYTQNPKKFWIKGLEGGDHITLLYGLLTQAFKGVGQYHRSIDRVLELTAAGVPLGGLPQPQVDHIGYFESPYEAEEYACIVAHLHPWGLLELHQRLSFLPHVNTFPQYRPHLTLGYVKAEYRERTLVKLENLLFNGQLPPIQPIGIDYGKFQS